MKKTISIILIALVSLLKSQVIPNSQIKFYVNFEGNGNDYTSQKTCSNTSTTFSTSYGIVGQGAHFNGSANLKYTPVGGYAFNNVGCFGFWFKSTQTNAAYLYGNSNSVNTESLNAYNVKLNNDGTTTCKTTKTTIPLSNNVISLVSSTTSLNDGNWHFIVYGRLNTSDVVSTLLIDDVITATSSLPAGTTNGGIGSIPFRIGQSGDYTSIGGYIGDIDELGFYTNLTTTQATYLYNAGAGRTPPFN